MDLLSAVDLLLPENFFFASSISEELIKGPHHNYIAVFSPLLQFILFNVQFFMYIYEKKKTWLVVACCWEEGSDFLKKTSGSSFLL